MEEKTIQLPVNKLSYSSLTQLLRNPAIFKFKHILGVYSGKKGVSAMVGSAAHEALKYYYGGCPDEAVSADDVERRAEAIAYGMKYFDDYDDNYIRYGKTGSRASMIETYAKTMTIYFEYEPEYHNILVCEKELEAEIENHQGQVFPLPAVGKPDLVVENKDETVDIIDTKFVKSFTKYEDEEGDPYEDYVKIVQAKFLDYLVRKVMNIQAKRVIFREVKNTINKDGSPQIRDYVIPLDHQQYDIFFVNIYSDVVKMISNPDTVSLS